MGKGGTKFDGVAKTSRVKTGGSMTYTDLKKNMEIYKQTGQHPLLEAAKAAKADAAVALPVVDTNRPHIYIEYAVDGKSIGKLVFELFNDHAPQAANHIRYRVNPGTADSLQGDQVHKFLSGFAVFGGQGTVKRAQSASISKVKHIRCTVPGCIAVSHDGKTYAVSLSRALKLDDTYQVAGRMLEECEPVLAALREVGSSGLNDAPSKKITVLRCGPCSHTGVVESLTGPEQTDDPEALKKLSEQTRDEVAAAVAAGLKKRKTEEGGAAAGAGAGAAPAAKKSKGLFDAVLGELSSDSSDDE